MSGGGWQQVSRLARAVEAAALEQALENAGAASVALLDPGGEPVLEPGPDETPLWPQLRVQALVPPGTEVADFLERLAGLGGGEPAGWEVEAVPERPWERAWMDDFRPLRFGRRLWVVPFHTAPPEPAAVNLRLDPGLAFGTGTHPTTALCLEWLDTHLEPGLSVLDFGCGSGILAVAALLLGAPGAQAVDIDPQALQASAANAEANGVADRLRLGTPESAAAAPVVLANIVAGTLVTLAPVLAGLMHPGGRLVLSGLLAGQQARVQAAYPSLAFEAPRERDGWLLLVARKPRRGGKSL